MPDAVGYFSSESMYQHAASCLGPDASRAQIKDRFFVQLADGRSVRALYVVRVDLQLRLGVGGCVFRKQQVFIGLLGIGFLSGLPNQNAAMEDPFRAAIQNAVVILVAVAMRLGVLDYHVMVGQLIA